MPVLKRGSRVQFNAGSVSSVGEFIIPGRTRYPALMGISAHMAFDLALNKFCSEVGRLPEWEKVRFRGWFTSFAAGIELNEDGEC